MWKTILKKALVSQDMDEHIDNLPKQVGSMGYDMWGYHQDGAKIGLSIIEFFYKHYFRVETEGLEHVPKNGRLLIIANHSGQVPVDAPMISYAMVTSPYNPRLPRAMIERFFPGVPYINHILNQSGAVIGDPINCVKMLENEEAILVFPEGVRGSGKMFKDRYKLMRFGNGFMHIALETDTPILPVAVVGGEETLPTVANIKPLARMLKLPYFPITVPFFLPAKIRIYFGEPMYFKGAVDMEENVTEKVEQVKDVIRRLIKKGLSARKGWWF